MKEQEKNRRDQARRTQPYYIPGDCDDEEQEEDPPQRASLESYLYGSRATSPSCNGAASSTGAKAAEKPKAAGPASSRRVAPAHSNIVLDLDEDSFDDRDSSMSPPPVTRNPVRPLPRARPQILPEDDIDQEMLLAIEEDIVMEDSNDAHTVSDLACEGPASEKIGDDLLLELIEDTEKSEAEVHSEDVRMADVEDEMEELDFDFDFEKPSFKLLDLPQDDEPATAPQVNYLVDILVSSSPFEGTVRAAVRNSVSMLSVDGLGRYTATVTLEDGTAVCTAVLSSSVIQEHCLGGLSPQEYQHLKGTHTPEAKAKLSEAGQLLERNLAQMEGMMTLAFGSGASKEPCQVLELRRPGTDDMDALFAAAGIERRIEKQADKQAEKRMEERVAERAEKRVEERDEKTAEKSSPARAHHPAVAPSPICIDDSPALSRTSKNALYCSPRPSSPSPEESPIIVTSPLSKRGSQSPRHKLARSRRQIRRCFESDSDEEVGSAVEDLLAGRASESPYVGTRRNDSNSVMACAEGHFDEEKDSCGAAVVFGNNHPWNVSKSFEGGGSAAKASLLAIKVALERTPKNEHVVVHSYSREAVETMNTKMQAWRRTGFQGPNKQLLQQISRLEDKFAKPPTYALIDSSVLPTTRGGAHAPALLLLHMRLTFPPDALTASALARQAL